PSNSPSVAPPDAPNHGELASWSPRRDSNPRPPAYKAGALPIELLGRACAGPGYGLCQARGCLTLRAEEGRLPGMALSDRERAIIDFERSWWAEPGPKELAIRERF